MSIPPDDTPIHRTTGARIAVTVLLVVSLAYALLIAQQILLWVVLVLATVGLWYAARLVVALERIADQLARLVEARSTENRSTED